MTGTVQKAQPRPNRIVGANLVGAQVERLERVVVVQSLRQRNRTARANVVFIQDLQGMTRKGRKVRVSWQTV